MLTELNNNMISLVNKLRAQDPTFCLSLAFKATAFGKTVQELCNIGGQERELSVAEKINFCCKASFAIAQGIDLISVRSSRTTRLATTASVGITGIVSTCVERYLAGRINNLDDIVALIGLVATQVGISFSSATEASPQTFGAYKDRINNASMVVACAGGFTAHHPDVVSYLISFVAQAVHNVVLPLFHNVYPAPHNMIQQNNVANMPHNMIQQNPEERRFIALAKIAIKLKNSDRIPCLLDDLKITGQTAFRHRCFISTRAIRHIVVPALAKIDALTPSYERAEAEKWLREKPNEAPPGWPEQQLPLPLQQHYFVSCRQKQYAIERATRKVTAYYLDGLDEIASQRALEKGILNFVEYKFKRLFKFCEVLFSGSY